MGYTQALMKKTPDGKLIVPTAVLCEIFHVHRNEVTHWADMGCPKYDRGWWQLDAVLEWRGLGKQKGGKKSDEAKKLEADADIKYAKARQEELKLAEMMDELIPKTLVEATLTNAFDTVRQRLLALPNQVRTETFAMYPDACKEVTDIADRAVRECLDYLAGTNDAGAIRKVGKKSKRVGRPRKKALRTSGKNDRK